MNKQSEEKIDSENVDLSPQGSKYEENLTRNYFYTQHETTWHKQNHTQ